MDWEYISGLMVRNMMDNGIMGSDKEKEYGKE